MGRPRGCSSGCPVGREEASSSRQCLVEAGVSAALRVALASNENGIDMNGAAITGTGEPPTTAKVRAITRTGAKWIPWYAFYEGGFAGTGCANPLNGTDVHSWQTGLR